MSNNTASFFLAIFAILLLYLHWMTFIGYLILVLVLLVNLAQLMLAFHIFNSKLLALLLIVLMMFPMFLLILIYDEIQFSMVNTKENLRTLPKDMTKLIFIEETSEKVMVENAPLEDITPELPQADDDISFEYK